MIDRPVTLPLPLNKLVTRALRCSLPICSHFWRWTHWLRIQRWITRKKIRIPAYRAITVASYRRHYRSPKL